MFQEFREFIRRGNVIDLAVAVVMGAAFSPIVNSIVNDLMMPPIGLVVGQVDFKDLFITLGAQSYPSLAAAKAAGAPVIAYGNFLNTVVNFLIVSFAVFLLVKQINRLHRPSPAATPTTKDCPYCLTAIPLKATRCPHCTSDLKGT
jgi:large conductance mechanosensitive channel